MGATTYTIVNDGEGNVLLESKYSNLIVASQNAVWNFLRNTLENSTNNSFKTKNVLDRIPEKLTEGTGFPYVIVPLPSLSEERLTFTQKRIFVTFDIEVWVRNTATAVLIDEVRRILSAQTNFFDFNLILHQFINTSGDLSVVELPDGDRVQQYRLTVQYEWIGTPS